MKIKSWSELTDIRLNRVRVNEVKLYLSYIGWSESLATPRKHSFVFPVQTAKTLLSFKLPLLFVVHLFSVYSFHAYAVTQCIIYSLSV